MMVLNDLDGIVRRFGSTTRAEDAIPGDRRALVTLLRATGLFAGVPLEDLTDPQIELAALICTQLSVTVVAAHDMEHRGHRELALQLTVGLDRLRPGGRLTLVALPCGETGLEGLSITGGRRG